MQCAVLQVCRALLHKSSWRTNRRPCTHREACCCTAGRCSFERVSRPDGSRAASLRILYIGAGSRLYIYKCTGLHRGSHMRARRQRLRRVSSPVSHAYSLAQPRIMIITIKHEPAAIGVYYSAVHVQCIREYVRVGGGGGGGGYGSVRVHTSSVYI